MAGARASLTGHGTTSTRMVACVAALTDVNPGDGGLVVVPGSHKANFPLPDYVRLYEADHDIFYNPPAKAGDLIIFNESTTHGTIPWKGKGERRVIFFRYVPKYFSWVPAELRQVNLSGSPN